MTQPTPKRILFLMSDTGGGHRAAAEAIRDALGELYGADAFTSEMVDVYRQLRYPSNTMPELYPWMIKNGVQIWTLGYRLFDTRRTARMVTSLMFRNNRKRLRRMAEAHPADVVVCVHSVIGPASMDAYLSLPQRPPFVTVVTDLVSTPAFWYDPRVDLCMVPTQAAFDRGLKMGMGADQMRVTGLPVHPRFSNAVETLSSTDKASARASLGWQPELPTVLLMAGGEGMGPVFKTTEAVVEMVTARGLKCQLVVVAGKNKPLKAQLDEAARDWQGKMPVYPYGFVTEMPRMMAAADMLVTKAGPATICEACIAGLPMIISGLVPGQEDGNVDFVVDNDAGTFAPGPQAVAQAVVSWLSEPRERLQQRAANAHKIARPDAVWEIARTVWQYADRQPVQASTG